MDYKPYISVIAPAYNEADNIVKTIKEIREYFLKRGFSYEIIIVDDGSTDKTAEIVKNYFDQLNLKLIQHNDNKGKGAAVKTGMLAASGEIRLFMDSDNQISIENFDKFIKNIDEGYDVIIGSYIAPVSLSNILDYRFFLGSLAKILTRFVMSWDIKDSQRGFKAFTATAAENIFKKQTINGWGFDIEVLTIALQSRLKIKEVPVIYKSNGRSRVNLFSYLSALKELFAIKMNLLLGKYKMDFTEKTNWNLYYSDSHAAPKYVQYFRKVKGDVLVGFMLKYGRNQSDAKIVELGGGDSYFYSLIKEKLKPKEYHIIDNNKLGLDRFEEKFGSEGGIFLHNRDVMSINNDLRADIAFSVGLVEHFSIEGTRKCIQAHFKALTPGGIAIIAFPTPTFLYRFTRFLATLAGKWLFHDERPLLMREVSSVMNESGTILDQKIIWPVFLTQAVIVARKSN